MEPISLNTIEVETQSLNEIEIPSMSLNDIVETEEISLYEEYDSEDFLNKIKQCI